MQFGYLFFKVKPILAVPFLNFSLLVFNDRMTSGVTLSFQKSCTHLSSKNQICKFLAQKIIKLLAVLSLSAKRSIFEFNIGKGMFGMFQDFNKSILKWMRQNVKISTKLSTLWLQNAVAICQCSAFLKVAQIWKGVVLKKCRL